MISMAEKPSSLTLHERVLRAALHITGGDISKTFSAEDVLVQAWKEDNEAWGLRGYAAVHPDANRIYTKLDGEAGLVAKGFLKSVGQRTYTLTEAGVSRAAALVENSGDIQIKLERDVQTAVLRVLEHPVFHAWLTSEGRLPSKFREAGIFWGIAPGTPPKVIRSRIQEVDMVLNAAEKSLASRSASGFVKEFGGNAIRFGPEDIKRCREFQATLKQRFAKDLRVLDPEGSYI